MELYYLCIDFVFQFIVEKYRNKLNSKFKFKIQMKKLHHNTIHTYMKYTN